jgi:thiamine pyrophosphokinase
VKEWHLFFMEKRTIILANGKIHSPDIIRARLVGWEDVPVFAADGGSHHAATLGLPLKAVIGDLDSLDNQDRICLTSSGARLEISPAHKDETDLELALLYAAKNGAEHIIVLGALGGRLDMSLANIHLLCHPNLINTHIEIWEDQQTTWILRPPGERIVGQPSDTLSLIPLSGNVEGITTDGLEYPMKNETLFFGLARGVSNVFVDTCAYVKLCRGILLAIHTPGRA